LRKGADTSSYYNFIKDIEIWEVLSTSFSKFLEPLKIMIQVLSRFTPDYCSVPEGKTPLIYWTEFTIELPSTLFYIPE